MSRARAALRPRRAGLVAAVVALVATWPSGCAADAAGELDFVDRVRNEHPSLSVDDVSDEELVGLGRSTCSPAGLDRRERARLAALGIRPGPFERLAADLCPSR